MSLTPEMMTKEQLWDTIEALRGEVAFAEENNRGLACALSGMRGDMDRLTAEAARLKGEVALLRRSLGKRQEQLEAAEQEAARLKGALVEQVKQYPDYSDICRKALAGETT